MMPFQKTITIITNKLIEEGCFGPCSLKVYVTEIHQQMSIHLNKLNKNYNGSNLFIYFTSLNLNYNDINIYNLTKQHIPLNFVTFRLPPSSSSIQLLSCP
jgi:hypothetical protein